jgi:hypothetical protein
MHDFVDSYDDTLAQLRFTLENHVTFDHQIALALTGLPLCGYRLLVDGVRQPAQTAVDGALNLQVPVTGAQVVVELVRAQK